MQVYLKEEYDDLPKGSCIEVSETTDTEYIGTWSFRGATIEVSVPKKLCVNYKKEIDRLGILNIDAKTTDPELMDCVIAAMDSIDDKEICSKINKETYGFDIGDIFYHYETIGRVYWGMHEYKVKKIGTGCMCHTDYYVDFEFLDNDGKTSFKHVSSVELKRDFSSTKKEAWKKHYLYLEKEIKRWSDTVENLKKSQRGALREYNKESK